MKNGKKANKLERAEQKRRAVEYHQAGTGMYLFRNRSSIASLDLPKVSADGKKWVGPSQTWKGDSYFMSMVPRDAVLVESLCENNNKEESKVEDKLILDQPEQVTSCGKVEHSVSEDLPEIVESFPKNSKSKERLITEDPLAGVTIIRD
jgi:lipoate-protein ligase A